MLIHLGCSALVVFVGAGILQFLGAPSLLALVHLVLAAAVMPLIFGAIAHFVPVLTRSREPPRSVLFAPVLLQLAGLLTFLHFYGETGVNALLAAAVVSFLVAAGFAGWLVFRAGHTLGKPHPCWRWYLAAIASLAAGLALVPFMYFWPEFRHELRLLHIHLNTLGFVGLTALGTLQVLVPTVLSGPDLDASNRLRHDLPLAGAGVLLIGMGAALWWPLSVPGAGLLFLVAFRHGLAWWRRYGASTIGGNGASAALGGALCGFLLMLIAGVFHASGLISGHDAVPGFVVAFLFPLITGALSQLLPVWRYSGRSTSERLEMRKEMLKGGFCRALLFLLGGALLVAGQGYGLWFAAIGLASFVVALIRGVFFSAR